MRKNLFLVSGLLAATLFTACNNEEITMPQGDNEASQELVLALSDGSLNIARSSTALAVAAASAGDAGAINAFGRPLYSSMASQYMQNIKIYFVKDGKIARVVTVDKDYWKQSLAYNNGRKLTISLKGTDKLETGKYTVYAMAYSTNHGYNAFMPVENTDDTAIDNPWKDFYASVEAKNDPSEIFAGQATVLAVKSETEVGLKSNTDDTAIDNPWKDFYASVEAKNDPSEIFAGQATVLAVKSETEVGLKSNKGEALVTLYRQVAGISGYFKNIPANVDGDVPTHLRLVASGKNTKVLFGELDTNTVR